MLPGDGGVVGVSQGWLGLARVGRGEMGKARVTWGEEGLGLGEGIGRDRVGGEVGGRGGAEISVKGEKR